MSKQAETKVGQGHRGPSARYAEARHAAYHDAQREFQAALGADIRLTLISAEALRQAASWSSTCSSTKAVYLPGWNREVELRKFRRRPRRVEVAIWYGEALLCGIALGRISDRRVVATIHFLQGNPLADNPISGKVGALATRFLEIYALELGCTYISIEHPVPELIEYYENLGFTNRVVRGRRVIRLTKLLDR
ncbi:hypothetical protein FNU76_11570 [Chitinimonas arctica]|uniref:GNAT family N-acetyltransferase n=2 Tax=Chitinimonas arctica TaxID=2594795 RepID=A0A516SFL6_9NEIS|nr:hypothetical protein FNU76_11570 [Chitinimonas arctica]